MRYKIDVKRITDGKIHIEGWVLPKKPYSKVEFKVLDCNETINFSLIRTKRCDVAETYLNDYNGNIDFGFCIEFPYNYDTNKSYKLFISTENNDIVEILNKDNINSFNSFKHKKIQVIKSCFKISTLLNAFGFIKKEGFSNFIKKLKNKLNGFDVDYDYNEWYQLTKTTNEELNRQKKDLNFKIKPLFSIVIPVFDTDTNFLKLLINSILIQTYQNFEICIADATDYSNCKNNPKKFFDNIRSEKIKIKYLGKNYGISNNTNAAIDLANGDYIVFVDHDDELTPDALYEIVKALNDNPNSEFIYSDEDKVDTISNEYFEPAFKPDFNIDMLLSVNYICHLTTIKKSLLDKLKSIDNVYERSEYDGAQDYDLYLRLVKLTNNIIHIPKVLYHWRCHKKSTSKNVSSKNYAFDNGLKAINSFYNTSNFSPLIVDHVEKGYDFGTYHTVFKFPNELPLISIIIPNKDHIDDLKTAINSVNSGTYTNFEYIICENNSVENETFHYYDELIKYKNVKVVEYKGDFNYSKINNFASKFANGKYLLLLNNDIEMINKNSIFEMLSYIVRNDVGAVGAKLLYKDKTIQHAGVILGLGGAAGHAFVSLNNFEHTYMNRAHIVQNYNAVTAACLLVKKDLFEKIGGFDENIAVAFNDIDLCIKIRESGNLIVYTPYASFYHYESKSRGYENTKEKINRFNHETAYLIKKWSHILRKIDNYYNPNLTLRKADFSLRNLKFEKIGELYKLPDEIESLIKSL